MNSFCAVLSGYFYCNKAFMEWEAILMNKDKKTFGLILPDQGNRVFHLSLRVKMEIIRKAIRMVDR